MVIVVDSSKAAATKHSDDGDILEPEAETRDIRAKIA